MSLSHYRSICLIIEVSACGTPMNSPVYHPPTRYTRPILSCHAAGDDRHPTGWPAELPPSQGFGDRKYSHPCLTPTDHYRRIQFRAAFCVQLELCVLLSRFPDLCDISSGREEPLPTVCRP